MVQFFTKTKAEMTGDADTVGAGAKVLVKGLVGGTFGSAAKITGESAFIRALASSNSHHFTCSLMQLLSSLDCLRH